VSIPNYRVAGNLAGRSYEKSLKALPAATRKALLEGRWDVFEGAVAQAFQTLIFARTGETDKAISEIERLLITPFVVDYADDSITLSDLRTRWEWDPIRKDPRFQKLLVAPK
jgi:hypothetical protein